MRRSLAIVLILSLVIVGVIIAPTNHIPTAFGACRVNYDVLKGGIKPGTPPMQVKAMYEVAGVWDCLPQEIRANVDNWVWKRPDHKIRLEPGPGLESLIVTERGRTIEAWERALFLGPDRFGREWWTNPDCTNVGFERPMAAPPSPPKLPALIRVYKEWEQRGTDVLGLKAKFEVQGVEGVWETDSDYVGIPVKFRAGEFRKQVVVCEIVLEGWAPRPQRCQTSNVVPGESVTLVFTNIRITPPVAQPSPPPPIVTAPTSAPAAFWFWLDVQGKNPWTLARRPVLTTAKVGQYFHKTDGTKVLRVKQDSQRGPGTGDFALFQTGAAVNVTVDLRGATVLLEDGRSLPVPDRDDPVIIAALYVAVPASDLPELNCSVDGAWKLFGQVPFKKVGGQLVFENVSVQGEMKLGVELRTGPGQAIKNFGSHCRVKK